MSTKQPIWPSGRFGVPQITPFTYRDGHTHLELIESLRDYLVKHLHPSLVSTVDSLVEHMEAEYGKALDQYVNGVEEFQRIHDRFMSDVNASLMALNDTAVSDLLDDDDSLLHQTTSRLIYRNVPQVTVGQYGQYRTLNEVFDDYPDGGVSIYLMPETHQVEPLTMDGVTNVRIEGAGMDATHVEVPGQFINALGRSSQWNIGHFSLTCTDGHGGHNGIEVEYPERWEVHHMKIYDFTGSAIKYKGGLQSDISYNYIGVSVRYGKGHAAVHITYADGSGEPATTITTQQNYVVGGYEQGFYYDYASGVGTVSVGDIVEHCDIGFRFRRSNPTMISPYTEVNDLSFSFHDSRPPIIGSPRVLSTSEQTWEGVGLFERQRAHYGNDYVDPGKGIVYGGQEGNHDFDTSPSIRWDSANPNGRLTAPRGSIAIVTTGNAGSTLYVKDSETGDRGWNSLQTTNTVETSLSDSSNPVNTDGKYSGKQVYDVDNHRPVWATGSSPTARWVYADGTTAFEPS